MQSWDIFCAVVDNFGDIGVCWRLARQLSERRFQVRLWVDKLETFAVICPEISIGTDRQFLDHVEVCRWVTPFQVDDVADVVIEGFGCVLPDQYLAAMAERQPPPVWVNLEYLSAEAWVDECHLLSSPHPQWKLNRTFFFPGLTEHTGGLLRESHIPVPRSELATAAVDALWQRLDLSPRITNELCISLFCYENPTLPLLLEAWASDVKPVRVLVFPGAACQLISQWGKQNGWQSFVRKSLSVHPLPFLDHSDYDLLLQSCDINFVRGEDSFVRAHWARRPFVWQIYPQADDAHLVKLDAFLDRSLSGMPDPAAEIVRRFWHDWNGPGKLAVNWDDFRSILPLIQTQTEQWVSQLDRMPDLVDNLVRFVRGM